MAKSNMINIDSIKTVKTPYSTLSKLGDYAVNAQIYNMYNSFGYEILSFKKKNKTLLFLKKNNINRPEFRFTQVKSNLKTLLLIRSKRVALNINQNGTKINARQAIINKSFLKKKKNFSFSNRIKLNKNKYILKKLSIYKKNTIGRIISLYENYNLC